MQLALQLGEHLLGPAQDQMVEAAPLEDREGELPGPAEVVLGSHRLVAVHVVFVPFAPVVLVSGQFVEQGATVGDLTHLDDEHPGPLTVGEQDRETLVLLAQSLQLSHLGTPVDNQLIAHGNRQLQGFPQARGRTGEQRQPPDPRAVQPTAYVGCDPLQVLGRGAPAVERAHGASRTMRSSWRSYSWGRGRCRPSTSR